AVPEVPTVSGPGELASLGTAVERAFSPDGPIARALDAFEARPGQLDMAGAVARTLNAGGVLLADTGTGTGKTLALIRPRILSGKRVLVSTGNKNLQRQLLTKDVPLLRRALGIPFTATCMKGRANYLCRHRFEQAKQEGTPTPADRIFLTLVEDWLE